MIFRFLDEAKPTLPTNFEEDTWAKLKAAINAIFLKQPVSCSLEDYYQVGFYVFYHLHSILLVHSTSFVKFVVCRLSTTSAYTNWGAIFINELRKSVKHIFQQCCRLLLARAQIWQFSCHLLRDAGRISVTRC